MTLHKRGIEVWGGKQMANVLIVGAGAADGVLTFLISSL